MATLLLRLAAPLQSWGVDSKFETRKTNREPTKSGVIGLLAAALGIRRDDVAGLQRLNQLHCSVRVDQEGELLVDFHTAKALKDQYVTKRRHRMTYEIIRDEEVKTPYVTYRHYLADAIFLVALESDDIDLLKELSDAIQHPVFPLYLGRRSCPPTFPICLGIRDCNMHEALEKEPWLVPEWRQRKTTSASLRVLTETDPGEHGAAPLHDLPLSFDPHHRQFGYRTAVETYVDMPIGNIAVTEHDAFMELE